MTPISISGFMTVIFGGFDQEPVCMCENRGAPIFVVVPLVSLYANRNKGCTEKSPSPEPANPTRIWSSADRRASSKSGRWPGRRPALQRPGSICTHSLQFFLSKRCLQRVKQHCGPLLRYLAQRFTRTEDGTFKQGDLKLLIIA